MFRRQIALGQRRAQPHRGGIFVVGAGEAGIEAIEQASFSGRRQRGMIGDVVGGAHEIVERQDRRAVARMNKPRRNREILIPVSLARPPSAGVSRVDACFVHRNSETLS